MESITSMMVTQAISSHKSSCLANCDVSDYYQVDTVAKRAPINHFWNLKDLYQSGINGTGITVAILDSSVNKNHDAFKGIKLEGKTFLRSAEKNELPHDDFWYSNREKHGTMVAGIVAGVAPMARIFVCCVSQNMEYDSQAVIKALTYLCEHKPHVVVMSFGCRPLTEEELTKSDSDDEKIMYKQERRRLIRELVKNGVVCIAAIGNKGLYGYGIASPACLPDVIGVGSLNTSGFPSQFNNPGKDQIDVYAPGENISAPTSDDNHKFQIVKGTSCAAPAIGGIVALLFHCATEMGSQIKISNIKILKQLFSRMLKTVDGDKSVLCPKDFFQKYRQHISDTTNPQQ